MYSSRFLKLSGTAVLVVFLVLGGIQGFALAAPLGQATAVATTAAATPTNTTVPTTVPTVATTTVATTAPTVAATTVATTAATTVATAAATLFPPCPPGAPAPTAAATTAATAAGTAAAATAPGTQAATTPVYIGIRVENVAACGVRVLEVFPNSPAAGVSLQPQDIVVGLDGQGVTGTAWMRQFLATKQPGDKLRITFQRAGQEQTVEITLIARPADLPVTVVPPGVSTSAPTTAATVAATTAATTVATAAAPAATTAATAAATP
jgi:predicted metalloprotease with PDZ domain